MQISDQFESLSLEIGCGLCLTLTIGFFFIKLVALITGWHLVGLLIFIYGIYRLLKYVGTFALYPGCFIYIKADIEIKSSQRINEQINKNLQELLQLLDKCERIS
jgi:hypothetical protein